MSRQAFARLLGYRSASGYYRYEDPDLNQRDFLPALLIGKLGRLVGTGSPPITPEDIDALAAPPAGVLAKGDGRAEIDAAYARLGSALASGQMEAAAGHCHILLGAIALFRVRSSGR